MNRLFLPMLYVCGLCFVAGASPAQGASPQAAATSKAVGTIKSISGNSIVLAVEGGADTNVVVQDGARLLQIEPGETDLKKAQPLQLSDLQTGDRILVRGGAGPDGKSIVAVSVIAMKKADLAAKHAHDQAEWQRHGIGGLVSAVDPAAGTITVATSALGANKNVLVHVSKNTVLRRYAPGSVKFDDAAAAPIDQIKSGDQLRARGQKSADGGELTADEVVSGSFRNISGTINSVDAAAKSITVQDLITKKPVVVKIADTSQLRKLPAPMAQRIAARLKGNGGEGPAGARREWWRGSALRLGGFGCREHRDCSGESARGWLGARAEKRRLRWCARRSWRRRRARRIRRAGRRSAAGHCEDARVQSIGFTEGRRGDDRRYFVQWYGNGGQRRGDHAAIRRRTDSSGLTQRPVDLDSLVNERRTGWRRGAVKPHHSKQQ